MASLPSCLLPPFQAVYTVLREAEHRSTAPIPYWNIPGATLLVPRQRRCQEALKVVNNTLDELIDKCKKLVGRVSVIWGGASSGEWYMERRGVTFHGGRWGCPFTRFHFPFVKGTIRLGCR